MKVYSARCKSSSKSRQRTRSVDDLESFYERSRSPQKSKSGKLIRSNRIGKEYASNSSLHVENTEKTSQISALHEIAAFRAQSHTRRVKFSEMNYNSWYSSNMCMRHLLNTSESKDTTIALKERDYCEVLGNRFCKVCSKVNARKECEDDFESTYLSTPKPQPYGTRSMTPLSDVILCKCPPLPQSDSKGLFVRLHEFQSLPPQYYINPMEGIYSGKKDTNEDDKYLKTKFSVDSCLSQTSNEDNQYIWYQNTSHGTFMDRAHNSDKEQQDCTSKTIDTEETTQKSNRLSRSFKAAINVALATVPMRKSNTFLPELHIKEINKQIKHILKEKANDSTNKGMNHRRRESFKDMPIEPPQITVNFALGIFDPKKRLVKRSVTYSANL